MPYISEMRSPALPLSGLELLPALQGGGVNSNVGVPMLAYGGLPTGSVLALRAPMLADLSDTADADPGAGNVRWDNADPDLATELYVSDADADADAESLSAVWAALSVGGFVYVQASADSERRDTWQKWQVTSVSAETGYVKLGVTLADSDGAFVDAEEVEFTAQQPTPSPGTNRNVVTVLSSSSGAVTVDCSLGDYFTLTPTEDITSWSFTNWPAAATINIVVTQGATPYDVAMPSGLTWPGGAAGEFSTDANAQDEISISTTNAGGVKRAVLGKGFE